MGKGRGAPAAGRGRHFSWPLGSFSRRRQNLGWGVGSMSGPAAAPASSPLGSLRSLGVARVAAPELGTRQSGSPRPRPGCLHTLASQRPGYLRTHRAVRGAHALPPPLPPRRGGPESRPAPPSAPRHLVAEPEPYPCPSGSLSYPSPFRRWEN